MKTCRIITEVFHFYATCFILLFLLRTFFTTVQELLHLLTVHPKLIFCGALKKSLMVLEDKSYQYFVKIFSSSSSLILDIHFYLHFQESSENALWIVIALRIGTFSAPDNAPETALEICILCYFSKTWLKICR